MARCLALPAAPAEETAETSRAPMLDTAVMRQHLDLLGSDYAGRIVATFAETKPDIMAALRAGMDGGDLDTVGSRAHSLKSAAGNVGLTRVADLARRLEQAARDSDSDTSRRTMDALEDACAAATAELLATWRSLTGQMPDRPETAIDRQPGSDVQSRGP